jgi:hypothetical protein
MCPGSDVSGAALDTSGTHSPKTLALSGSVNRLSCGADPLS